MLRQFNASPFAQHAQHRQPKQLDIFDFDSTLFLSPLPSATLWHPNLIQALTSEDYEWPGWWRDIRSLQLGDEVEKDGWQGYWNEDVVAQAKESMADPDRLTVVLTGRRYHPFHAVIPRMLAAHGLEFDMVCLRPDPELADGPSVFKSTMDFKTSYILFMLANVPSIESIVMWDDRAHHVKRFQQFLDTLRRRQVLRQQGLVHYVPAVRPAFRPEWERRVVAKMLKDQKNVKLAEIPVATVIQLNQTELNKVENAFKDLYHEAETRYASCWRGPGAERPLLYGDKIILRYSSHVNANDYQSIKESLHVNLPWQHDHSDSCVGSEVKVKVVATSRPSAEYGLQLQVRIADPDSDEFSRQLYVLPLYHKPSENLFTPYPHQVWKPLPEHEQICVTGVVDYAYLYGLDTVLPRLGKRQRSYGNRTATFKPKKPNRRRRH